MVLGAFAVMFVGAFVMQRNNTQAEAVDAEKQREALELHWHEISRRTGLRLTRKSPYGLALHGVLEGIPVWFATMAMRDGRDVWWGVRAELPKHAVDLVVIAADRYEESGRTDAIPTGDDDFDLMYALTSNDPVGAFCAVSRAAQQALLVLGPAHLRVTQGVMELTLPFAEMDLDDTRIIATLELIRSLAQEHTREQTIN